MYGYKAEIQIRDTKYNPLDTAPLPIRTETQKDGFAWLYIY